MKIVHILANVSQINYGIWNVVVTNTKAIKDESISSYIISLSHEESLMKELQDVKSILRFIVPEKVISYLSSFDRSETIVITHGTWTKASYLGYKLSKLGYIWVTYPHGMLEPWSMKNKWLKKYIYYKLFERRYLAHANCLIAVGFPEKNNLERLNINNSIYHIPNGIVPQPKVNKKFDKLRYVFMARLHYKKGVMPLVQGWKESRLFNNQNFELIIAGPDEGEMPKIKALINNADNIVVAGGIYGEDKNKLLNRSHYYILPSLSEGFPSSIIEAMTHGCLPVITKGCNFPDIMDKEFTFEIKSESANISAALNQTAQLEEKRIVNLSEDAKNYVDANYSVQHIVEKQISLYKSLLN